MEHESIEEGAARATHAAMAFQHALLVFGGEQEPSSDDAVHAFHIADAMWRSVSLVGSPPEGRVAAAACCVEDERLFLFGGYIPDHDENGKVYSGSLHVLDLRSSTPRWRPIAPDGAPHAPSPRRDATLTWIRASGHSGSLLAFGGYDLMSVHNDLRRFDLQALEWSLPTMLDASQQADGAAHAAAPAASSSAPTASMVAAPLPRRGHSAVALGMPAGGASQQCLYLFGGCLGLSSYIGDLWTAELTSSGAAAWTHVATAGASPPPRAWHSASAIDGRHQMVVVGGRSARGCVPDEGAWLLDARTSAWAAVALPMGPCVRYSHSATIVGAAALLVYGGRDDDGAARNDVFTIDLNELSS